MHQEPAPGAGEGSLPRLCNGLWSKSDPVAASAMSGRKPGSIAFFSAGVCDRASSGPIGDAGQGGVSSGTSGLPSQGFAKGVETV